jgi:hypothetical protein
MSYTSNKFKTAKCISELSPGCCADYGLDPYIYMLFNMSCPNEVQFQSLFEKYLVLVSEQITPNELFRHFCANTLVSVLGEEFSWIRTTNMLM